MRFLLGAIATIISLHAAHGAEPFIEDLDLFKASECDNLFVTFALSASHTAFSSIRMEPVFMVTSQPAATAVCLAIDEAVPVQRVGYAGFRKRSLADGQVLEWMPEKKPANSARP